MDEELTPEEREFVRRAVREDKARRLREAQEKARRLTAELRRVYGMKGLRAG